MRHKVALFGEAEKGEFHSILPFTSLAAFAEKIGNPPKGSIGIHFAIQALLFCYELLFIRVEEEGFSLKDYMHGLHLLQAEETKNLSAIFIPGVGDLEIIEKASEICMLNKSLLITTEKDFYDYLTCFTSKKIN